MLSAWILTVALITQAPHPVTSPPLTRVEQQAPPKPAAVSPWTDDRPITHLFQNLAHDVQQLPSRESGGVLVFGAGVAALAHAKDQSIASWVHRQPSASYASVGNAIGDGWTEAGGAVATWAIGKASGNEEVAHVGGDLIRAQALNGLLDVGIKVAVNRGRPNGGTESFPSGHTSATFATAAVLQTHFGWGVGAASYAVAGFVGWSRIRSNFHWLSDVVFGSAIGVLSGRTVTRGHSSQWTVAPVKTPGGMAIVVARRSAETPR
jgi:membrane-associated phospholipid phosphatase